MRCTRTLRKQIMDEGEGWEYVKDSFDEERYPNGYVDYEIVVENGTIVKDTFAHDRVGKPFESFYRKEYWNTVQ